MVSELVYLVISKVQLENTMRTNRNDMTDQSIEPEVMLSAVERPCHYPGLELHALFSFVSQTFPDE